MEVKNQVIKHCTLQSYLHMYICKHIYILHKYIENTRNIELFSVIIGGNRNNK